MTDVDVAVIGAGLTGSCTAWQLATRGVDVALIDAYAPGHTNGSSHGSSRIFRRAYPDPFYVELTGAALPFWRQLESDSSTTLLRTTGGIDYGRQRDPQALGAKLTNAGVRSEVLSAAEARSRWAGIRFDGPVLFHSEAGVLDADATVAAAVRVAADAGAQLVFDNPVRAVLNQHNGFRIEAPTPITARRVVVAAGPWLPELAAASAIAVPRLTVRQQQVFHFALRDPTNLLPTFVHKDTMQMYGLPSGADVAVPSMKIGRFDDGLPTTATTRSGTITDEYRQPVIDYVRQYLPALDPDPVAEASCLFTMTDNEDFVIDRIGELTVASPCSGHGAKFAPLTGSMVADIVLGVRRPLPRFSIPAVPDVPCQ